MVGSVGRIIAADKSSFSPALYEADAHYIIPGIDEAGYIEAVTEICRKEKINAVLSLIDPELSVLAENREVLAETGAVFVASGPEQIRTAYDKKLMNEWLAKHGYSRAAAYYSLQDAEQAYGNSEIRFPMIIKPIKGSASVNCREVYDMQEAAFFMSRTPGLMIQEYIAGDEIGTDVYVDMLSGKVVSVFLKKKILMRAGETDKAVSIRDEELRSYVAGFAEAFGARGPLDVDIIAKDGQYFITDVNPRFGGGYPFAHRCGCDHIQMIVNNLNGIENLPGNDTYEENVSLMKYSDVLTVRGDRI